MKKIDAKIVHWDNAADLDLIIHQLKQNEIFACTGDTVLGLLGQLSEESFNKFNTIKIRQEKPYIVLVENAAKAALFSPLFETDIKVKKLTEYWPGPLTLIVPARPEIHEFIAPSGKIALRVPRHQGLLTILRYFDGLFSTSANISGEPVPQAIPDLDIRIMQQIEALVVDKNQEQNHPIPSTIIDCTTTPFTIVRQGTFTIDLDK